MPSVFPSHAHLQVGLLTSLYAEDPHALTLSGRIEGGEDKAEGRSDDGQPDHGQDPDMIPVYIQKRKHKFGAVRTNRGEISFDSKSEARYWDQLMLQLKAGEIKSIELQPKFELQPSYKFRGKTIRAINYIADFLVEYPDGRKEIIDCKGHLTQEFKLKKKLFHFRYPDLEIVEVKV